MTEKEIGTDEGARIELEDRVRSAVEEARGKWSRDEQARIEKVRAEERALAQMSAQERMAHEFDARSRELDEREAAVRRSELRARAVGELQGRGLPAELADVIDVRSEDDMMSSLSLCERAFRAAVGRGIEERMRGSAPQAANRQAGADVTDEEYYRARFGR